MKTKNYSVQYRRKREGKTEYKKRAKLLAANKPRAIIRRTLKRVIIQIAAAGNNGDIILTGTDSNALKSYGWKYGGNICTSYLTGYLAGIRAMKKDIKEAVLDIKSNTKGGNVYAALKGLIDAGLNINCDSSVFPREERLRGEHINKQILEDIGVVKNKLLQEAG